MLTRRREQFIALLGLIALNLGFGWVLSHRWKDYRSRTAWVYAQASAAPRQAGGDRPQRMSVAAQNFADIVSRTIFRPDRTNEPSAESAKPPELPLLYGTMNLGDGKFAMMAPGDQPNGLSKPVHPGEEIGGFKLVSLADSQVVVGWGEKQFTVSVWESARKVPRIVEKSAPPARSAESSAPNAGSRTATTAAPAAGAPVVVGGSQPKTGFAGFNAPPGAPPDAPVGTVIAGKRKVARPNFIGQTTYWWEDVEQPKAATQEQNPPKEK